MINRPLDGSRQAAPVLAERNPPSSNSTPTPGVERLLTYQEVGKLLGVTDRTVYSLVRHGDLLAVRFGRNVRIDPADLRRFIKGAKEGGGS